MLMVIANANYKGNWHFCRVNGHFEWFVVVVMCNMLKMFPPCVPRMICVTINFRARCQMIRRVPLQSLEAALRFLSKITRTPTLRARQCGGICARVMVLRNSVPIAITWSSPVFAKSTDKTMCSRPGITLEFECWESSRLYFLLSK
jgi:hypothetical protein